MQRVAQIGLGAIGRAIARRLQQQPGFELVGAADPDPRLAGQDLGQVLGSGALGIPIDGSLEPLLTRARPTLVLHATGSYLADVASDLRLLLDRGVSVVSTCEELAYPFQRHPALSRELDAAACAARAVLLGTGVNPGFVMDKLVLTLMGACTTVRNVRVVRVVDAARRRESFQRKIGAGLTAAQFEERRAGGRLGHVGLAESAHMLADVMGLPQERELVETLRPVTAERRLVSEFLEVQPGQVAGIDHTLVLHARGAERVRLELQMYLGASDQRDAISIAGSPPLEMIVVSGVPGDEGTAAVAVNSAHLVPALAPGLRTMIDVPLTLGGAAP